MIVFFKKKVNESFFFKKIYTVFKFFFYIRQNLIKTLNYNKIEFNNKKKTIIFSLIETSHPANFLLILLAKILQVRGNKVFLIVCDGFLKACEIKSKKNEKDIDPCFNCKFNQKKILPLYNIPVIKISTFDSQKLRNKINKSIVKFKKQNYNFYRNDQYSFLNLHIHDSVTRYFYGNIFLKKEKELNSIKIQHCFTALYNHEISKLIDRRYNPDAVVSTMSVYSSWFPFFNYFKKKGDRFRLFSLTLFNKRSFIFNEYNLYPAIKRFNKFLRFRNNTLLGKREKKVLLNFMNKRFKFNFKNTYFYNYQIKKSKIININKILKVDKKKKNIFLFPNIFWDVGLADRGFLFKDVLNWLFYTIDLLGNKQGINIYVKPHPAEFTESESLVGIKEIIINKFGNKFSNLFFIETNSQLKSYDLKKFIDLAIVFNGTLNLEFMLQKVPVIACGKSPTFGLGFTKEIKNLTDYKNILLNKNYNYSKLIAKDYNKLLIFSYFYFIKNPINWSYTKKVYGENFKGYNFKSLDVINKKDVILDHLINCILKGDDAIPESW
jgi:hypothetical protein